jgi:hypothetical protein
VTSDSSLWFGDSAKNDVLSFLTTCDLRSDAYTGMTGRLVVAANMTLFVERVVNANPLTVPSWDLETQGGAYVLVDMVSVCVPVVAAALVLALPPTPTFTLTSCCGRC